MELDKQNDIVKNKTVYVACNGCPENRLDVARAQRYLLENGWEIADNWKNAHLILFNACGRSSKTESSSLSIIKEIERQKGENQQLVVWGCLPKIDPVKLASEFKGKISPGSELIGLNNLLAQGKTTIDQTYGNTLGPVWPMNKSTAPEYLRYSGSWLTRNLKKPALKWDEYIDSHFNLVREKDPSIYYIKISTGCLSNCAYCAIKKSRGNTKSKSIDNIAVEFKEGLQKGFRKFSLMGTDLGAYGSDLGCDLVDLLEKLTSFPENYRLSLRNIHPYHLITYLDRFLKVLETGKIQYLEMAAESGSNHVLGLMKRPYSIEEFKECVAKIRRVYPPIIIRTQLIAGFSGETEKDFNESMKLLDDTVFDYVEVYEFSERPGTAAVKIEPKVPDAVKRERFFALYRKAILNRTARKLKNLLFNKL